MRKVLKGFEGWLLMGLIAFLMIPHTLIAADQKDSQPDVGEYKALNVSTVKKDVNKFANLSFPEQSSGTLIVELETLYPSTADFLGIKVSKEKSDKTFEPAIYLNLRDMTLGYRIPKKYQWDTDVMSEDAKVRENKWHKIKMEIDIDSKVNKYYVDDQIVRGGKENNGNVEYNMEESMDFLEEVDSVDTLELLGPNGNAAEFWIDNIKIYQEESPETIIYEENFERFDNLPVDPPSDDGWFVGGTDDDGKAVIDKLIIKEPPTSEGLLTEYIEDPNNHPNIPNNSYAGYRNGEVDLPNVPVVTNVLDHGGKNDGKTDNTEAFKRAIEEAATHGRGAVLIPEGDYMVNGLIHLNAPGVVLRGEGPGTRLIFMEPLRDQMGLDRHYSGYYSSWSFTGGNIWISPDDTFNDEGELLDYGGNPATESTTHNNIEQWRNGEGQRLAKITEDALEGSTTISVDDTSSLHAGDFVLLTVKNTRELMYQFAGHSLMENYNWDAATKLSVDEMPRYRWPVQIKEVKDHKVVLQQPLRFDAFVDSLDADFQTVGSYIDEVGVEDLTVENRGAVPNRTHLTDRGYNGIYFNRVFNGWTKNVKIHNAENGLLSSSVKNITATNIEMTGDVMLHHASTFRFFTTEMLFENFKIKADVDHGISTEWFSSGNVWSKGVMDHGTFDSHRVMPFDFIRTQITTNNDGRAGGAADAGPRNGKRLVHWNVTSPTGTNVFQPGLISMGALVGIQGTDMASGSPDMVSGDKGVIIADTGKEPASPNLYEAQLALRKGSNSWIHITNSAEFNKQIEDSEIDVELSYNIRNGRDLEAIEIFLDDEIAATAGSDSSLVTIPLPSSEGEYVLQAKLKDNSNDVVHSYPVNISKTETTDTVQEAVDNERDKYRDSAKIGNDTSVDTDVTDTILQLKDGEEADEGINLSYIVFPSTYLHIIDRDGEQRIRLRKKNKSTSDKTETVTITFEKNKKTAVKEIAVTIEGQKEEPSPEKPKEVDKSALQKKITEAEKLHESDYTKQTWTIFSEVLQKAKDVLDDDGVSQEEVNKSLEELDEALSALEYVNDNGNGKGMLPKTATYVYNALLLGVILLVIGGIILYIRRRRSQE